jgi:hypothetical protein
MTYGENMGCELEPDSALHIWQTARTREATGMEMALQVMGARLP